MNNTITFEYPFNERNRTLLKLEQLLIQLQFHTKLNYQFSARICITTLLDIAEYLNQVHIKMELTQALSQQIETLTKIKNTPGIDLRHLDQILNELKFAYNGLINIKHPLGAEIRRDPLMMDIQQKRALVGEVCAFNLPQYHLWLNQAADQRILAIQKWRDTLRSVSNAIVILLRLMRTSVDPVAKIAEKGLYQQPLKNTQPIQIIRVSMQRIETIYAEINHQDDQLEIKFINMSDKACKIEQDIPFQLSLCQL